MEGLRKDYGRRRALDALSLEVERGETLGLLGPNGAGKTTFMSLVAGLLRPDGGRIELRGLGPVTSRSVRGHIGIAPQEVALYPRLSAEENLVFFARLYGLRGAELRRGVERALTIAGLTERRRDRVGGFSGGMQRRLNLAAAVVHSPDLVLLDEPTAGVDPQSRNHIFDSLERLKDTGTTLIYSTHYMEEAERLCDRVAVMDNGKLLALGRLQELVQSYGGGYRVTAEVLEAPPPLTLADWNGAKLDAVVDEPFALLSELMRAEPRLSSLSLERPSLETVFFNLTGRSLRD